MRVKSPAKTFFWYNGNEYRFEVVVPDTQTMEHVVIPAIEAIKRHDMEGARITVKNCSPGPVGEGGEHRDHCFRRVSGRSASRQWATIKWARVTGDGG